MTDNFWLRKIWACDLVTMSLDDAQTQHSIRTLQATLLEICSVMAETTSNAPSNVQELSTDDVIAHIVSTTNAKDVCNHLLPNLRSVPSSTFLGQSDTGTDPLDQLDPQAQSLGYLFFMYGGLKSSFMQ
jgi:hypothetical protein